MPSVLLDLGRFWKLDDNGVILNDADEALIDPLFTDAVSRIRQSCIQHLGPRLEALYLRGSIPRGMAIPHVSDADLIALIRGEGRASDHEWAGDLARSHGGVASNLSGVGVDWCESSELLEVNSFSEIALQLATQSICICGKDIAPQLPRFSADWTVANCDIVQIEADVDEAAAAIVTEADGDEVAYWCRRVAKNLLRAGFSLTMTNVKQYTRDLAPCYLAFSKEYKDQRADMYLALELSVNPTQEPEKILILLASLGEWISKEAANWLEAYNPTRVLNLPLRTAK